jgi:hypothetical protein
MKTINFFKSLLVIAISLTLVQCTSDDPIPGPAGADGANGSNGAPGTPGTPGIDGGNVCLSCHNVDFKVVQPATFAVSGHASGAALPGRGGACLNCHSDAGYKGSFATNNITSSIAGLTDANAGVINCTTCHSGGHAAAALAISGKDAALRTADAYKLNQKTATGTDIIIDYKNNSNACIHCHQSRRNAETGIPPNATTGMISLSSHTGPHYGNQVAMLEGMFGAEISGTAYPAKGSAVHRTGLTGKPSSCTTCHMGSASTSGTSGNHTMHPKVDVCKTCHTGAGVVNFNINGGETKIKNLMLELAEEVVRLRPNDFVIYNYTGSKSFPAANIPNDPNEHANQLHTDGTTLDSNNDLQLKVAKSFWNWRYLYQDGSHGIHNPKYAETLLKNSIAALKALP